MRRTTRGSCPAFAGSSALLHNLLRRPTTVPVHRARLGDAELEEAPNLVLLAIEP